MVKWFDRVQKNVAELIVVVDKLDREVDADTIFLRKQICAACPNNINGKCNICKCFIDIKTTTKVNRKPNGKKEITHCPEGRWKDEYLKNFYNLLNQ